LSFNLFLLLAAFGFLLIGNAFGFGFFSSFKVGNAFCFRFFLEADPFFFFSL
jgi:hypothetical protein